MKLELILVPYEVERTDTPMARAPGELVGLGFDDALKSAGFQIHIRELWSEAKSDRPGVVTNLTREVARAVARASTRGRFPLILSAGCLTAVGVAHGLQRTARDFGVLWVDAHGDFNTAETTPSGYWDGMALGAVCGRSLTEIYKGAELQPVPFRRIVHLGGRALDPPELEDFERLNVLLLAPDEVNQPDRIRQVQERLDPVQSYYLHVDLDGLAVEEAPAVQFPEPDGLRLDALLTLIRTLEPPVAMTLSGMSFANVDDEAKQRQLQTCLKVVEATLNR